MSEVRLLADDIVALNVAVVDVVVVVVVVVEAADAAAVVDEGPSIVAFVELLLADSLSEILD